MARVAKTQKNRANATAGEVDGQSSDGIDWRRHQKAQESESQGDCWGEVLEELQHSSESGGASPGTIACGNFPAERIKGDRMSVG